MVNYSRCFQETSSVPVNPAGRPNPEEKAVAWRDTGDLDTSTSYLYSDNQVEECLVPKSDHLETEQQQPYMQWIEKVLGIVEGHLRILDCIAHTVT